MSKPGVLVGICEQAGCICEQAGYYSFTMFDGSGREEQDGRKSSSSEAVLVKNGTHEKK